MSILDAWPIVAAVLPPVVAVQWWVMRRIHRKELIATRERHLAVKQSAATLLQQARLQSAQAQQELAAARLAAKQSASVAAPAARDTSSARANLSKILDAEPRAKRAVSPDGFADTLPSLQFAVTTSFGLLQPSTRQLAG